MTIPQCRLGGVHLRSGERSPNRASAARSREAAGSRLQPQAARLALKQLRQSKALPRSYRRLLRRREARSVGPSHPCTSRGHLELCLPQVRGRRRFRLTGMKSEHGHELHCELLNRESWLDSCRWSGLRLVAVEGVLKVKLLGADGRARSATTTQGHSLTRRSYRPVDSASGQSWPRRPVKKHSDY